MPDAAESTSHSKRDRYRASGQDTDAAVSKRNRHAESRARSATSSKSCRVCGRSGHLAAECEFTSHLNANKSSDSFADSVNGKAYVLAGAKEDFPTDVLRMRKILTADRSKLENDPNYINTAKSSSKTDASRGNGGGSRDRQGGRKRRLLQIQWVQTQPRRRSCGQRTRWKRMLVRFDERDFTLH